MNPIDIQSEINRMRRNLEKMEKKGKERGPLLEQFKIMQEQQRVLREELMGFYRDAKETFLDLKSSLNEADQKLKKMEQKEEDLKQQIKTMSFELKKQEKIQERQKEAIFEQETRISEIESKFLEKLKKQRRSSDAAFQLKFEALSEVIQNQQKQIDILSQKRESGKIGKLEITLETGLKSMENRVLFLQQKHIELGGLFSENQKSQEKGQKSIQNSLEDFVRNLTEEKNSQFLYLNQKMLRIEELLSRQKIE